MFGAILGGAGLVTGLAEGASHDLSSIQQDEVNFLNSDISDAQQTINTLTNKINSAQAAFQNTVNNLDQTFGSTYGHYILQNFDLPSITSKENQVVAGLQQRIAKANSDIANYNQQEQYIKEHPQGGGIFGFIGRMINDF